jgi:hypothetical protein
MRQAVIALDNIDASIHIFDPELKLEDIKPRPVPPRHQAFKGEVSRIVFTTLRNAKVKLRTSDVAARVMAERGLDSANLRLRKLISGRVGSCMRIWEKKNLIRGELGPDRLKYWEIVRCAAPVPTEKPTPTLRQVRRLPRP